MTDDQTITFQTTLENFFTFAEAVLKYDVSGDLILASGGAQSNGIQVSLKGYQKLYEHTKTNPKHLEKIREIYQKCKPFLQKNKDMDAFMEWFPQQTLIIAVNTKTRNRVVLSAIFRKCCTIADKLMEDENQDSPATTFPESFMLHLFRLFHFAADAHDKEDIILPMISELENVLHLNKDEVPILNDSMGDMYSLISEIAEETGLELPKNGKNVNVAQFRQAMSSFTKNPEAKKMVKDLLGGVDLKNPQDLPATVGNLLQKMNDTAKNMPEALQRSMAATADSSS